MINRFLQVSYAVIFLRQINVNEKLQNLQVLQVAWLINREPL